ncbi:MAG: nucleotidyl transferase AbiEii/AbiGii toxin family protein [Nocardioidaceae bacterium]|nr:MAG: nucleotidyl transferase AbiEii/AbiGii toxin family protein [Nocardioidaceae bacterium]
MPGDPFADLPEKDRTPRSARVLDGWVRDAQKLVGSRGERVGWILASTIVAAALQRELRDGSPLFVLKGGLFIERVLDLNSRATKDIDTLYRGAETDLVDHIDRALAEPWGQITFSRAPVEIIDKARRVPKPRRLKVRLDIHGVRWRTIQVEASFAEGASGDDLGILPRSTPPSSASSGPTTWSPSRWPTKWRRSSTPAPTPTRHRSSSTTASATSSTCSLSAKRSSRRHRPLADSGRSPRRVRRPRRRGRTTRLYPAYLAPGCHSQQRVASHLAHPRRTSQPHYEPRRCTRLGERLDRPHRRFLSTRAPAQDGPSTTPQHRPGANTKPLALPAGTRLSAQSVSDERCLWAGGRRPSRHSPRPRSPICCTRLGCSGKAWASTALKSGADLEQTDPIDSSEPN